MSDLDKNDAEAIEEDVLSPDETPTLAQDGSGVSGRPSGTPGKPSSIEAVGSITEKPGDTIGPYKLLQQIGEGGFGVVYLAEQSKPVKRRVALKIIKPGMDTKEVIARFEAERQALALMDHPGIAKVFDAGATNTGRPYFVMELVKGVPVSEYCDTHHYNTRERLELFRDICGAVQHAHQKGVIHRDLKPSNILVTHQDSGPVVKVIDFGIAKSISQELTEQTLFTAFGQMVGTPQYMSPEQAEANGLDVDTRSDIYALGVVLYELLTSRTPLDLKQLREAGLDKIHQLIREAEPPKPSTKLTGLNDEEITAVARAHRESPEKLARLVRGDLDWIVMKALEKDRNRRYETATGFSEDVRRYLEDEPVLASPPSASYRLSKFARRNKAAIATAAVIVVTLVAAAAVSTWQAVEATKAREAEAEQREIAEENARQAKASEEEARAVLKFFQDKVLAAARPKEQAGGLGIDATIREAIDAAEPEIAEAFAGRPQVEASIRISLASNYHYIGEVEAAISQGEQALALRKKRLGLEHPGTLVLMNSLAVFYGASGRLDEALALHEESFGLSKKVVGVEHRDTLGSMQNLANSYRSAGRMDEALALLKESFELSKKVNGVEHEDTLSSMQNLTNFCGAAGQLDEALELGGKTLELRRKILGPEHPDTLSSIHNLAIFYRVTGQLDEALGLSENALELRRKILGPEHPDTLSSIQNLADCYRAAGQLDEALALREEALELFKKILGPEHPNTLMSMNNLADSYIAAERMNEALSLKKVVLDLRKTHLGSEHPDTLKSMGSLAFYFMRGEHYKDAENQFREYLSIQETQGARDVGFFYAQSCLGLVLTELKRFTEAEHLTIASYEGLKSANPTPDPKWLRLCVEGLVKLYTAWDKPDKAAEWQAKLEELESAKDKSQ